MRDVDNYNKVNEFSVHNNIIYHIGIGKNRNNI